MRKILKLYAKIIKLVETRLSPIETALADVEARPLLFTNIKYRGDPKNSNSNLLQLYVEFQIDKCVLYRYRHRKKK